MSENTGLTKDDFEVLKSVVHMLDENQEVFNLTQKIIETKEQQDTNEGLHKIKSMNEGEK